MLNLTVSLNWFINYYLERISIKFDELFGIFSQIIFVLFLLFLLAMIILWLFMPFIEISKRKLLQKIYYRSKQTESQVNEIHRYLFEREKEEREREDEKDNNRHPYNSSHGAKNEKK